MEVKEVFMLENISWLKSINYFNTHCIEATKIEETCLQKDNYCISSTNQRHFSMREECCKEMEKQFMLSCICHGSPCH